MNLMGYARLSYRCLMSRQPMSGKGICSSRRTSCLTLPLTSLKSYKGRINTQPGGLNYRDGGKDRIAKLDIAGQLEYSAESLGL